MNNLRNITRSDSSQSGGPTGPSAPQESRLNPGGGGPTFPSMEADLAVLKYRADQADSRMARVETKLDTLIEKVSALPTKNDLWQWKWQWTALSLATVAIVVGGIIGGLAWVKPDNAPAPSPTVINVQPAPITLVPTLPTLPSATTPSEGSRSP